MKKLKISSYHKNNALLSTNGGTLIITEIGECEDISHWISEAEYNKLPEDEKQDYTYYEWDEYGDWYAVFVKLSRMVDAMLEIFNSWSLCNIQNANLDERTPTADYVRLIVYID